MKKILAYFSILSLVLWINSCYYDSEEFLYPCDIVDSVSYSRDIIPIISGSCYGCHAAGGTANIPFDGYETFYNVCTKSGSSIICRINFQDGCNPMPPNGPKLGTCAINKITAWIDQGAQNN